MNTRELCRDVRDFLRELAGELPGIFPPRPLTPQRRAKRGPRRAHSLSRADRERARAAITARARHWAPLLGVAYGRIAIKDHRSLWGSCSRRGNLNFNWRLAAAPPEVLDYIVVHELCHLKQMNHSREFWALVAAALPAYKAQKKWLRDNCAALYRLPALPALPA